MSVEHEATVDLLGDTELRGTGKATPWRSDGAGLTIARGATVHMRDQAKITDWVVSTVMADHPAAGGTGEGDNPYHTPSETTPYVWHTATTLAAPGPGC
ncbi:hypothetical protein [Streptomyces xanthophaeus]|uniref:hypothetical protein n=1 Tax=Streptomyces xanthophaeus TaxID=67385 RepID=UPI00365A16C8